MKSHQQQHSHIFSSQKVKKLDPYYTQLLYTFFSKMAHFFFFLRVLSWNMCQLEMKDVFFPFLSPQTKHRKEGFSVLCKMEQSVVITAKATKQLIDPEGIIFFFFPGWFSTNYYVCRTTCKIGRIVPHTFSIF